jgi:acetyl-CoA C-acetyltransferase
VSLDPDRTPVIVAAGQTESRDLTLGPLELAEIAARQALDAAPGLAAAIERVTVVNILSHRAGRAPAAWLAHALGLGSVACETTNVGGNTPQAMVELAASEIARGELTATLIVGAEAVRSGRLKGARPAAPPVAGPSAARTSTKSTAPPPTPETPPPDPVIGADPQDLSGEERMAGLVIPVHVYPLFESALAARAGRNPAEQRQFIGRLMAPFTEVAARHPHAWFHEARTPEDLATVSPSNRLVAEPYVKRVVAFLGGAQAASLVVTSLSVATALGLDDGALFVWSGASANDVWYPTARPELWRSAGVEAAGAAALNAAGSGVDDVSAFDLYSCFPSAVQIAAAGLGLPVDVDQPDGISRLTVTGGLPYFGGPGNNYTTHAIATLFDRFRSAGDPDAVGLVTAVGWYLTKHAVGVYGASPRVGGFLAADTASAQQQINASALPRVEAADAVSSLATVDASTIMYDRAGHPVAAPLIATLDDGRRVAASADDGEVEAVAGTFLVGARVHVEASAGGQAAPRYRVVDLS